MGDPDRRSRPGRTWGAVIPAAGAGERLGVAAKALLRHGDRSFLAAIASCLDEVGVSRGDVVVVVGPPHRAVVAAEADRLGLAVVENPLPARGMASSIALGFTALSSRGPELEAALLWPVDHPAVAAATVASLAASSAAAVIPSFRGGGGHPVLVRRALWSAVAGGAEVDGGMRTILGPLAVRLDVDDPAVVRDVDHPSDVEAR